MRNLKGLWFFLCLLMLTLGCMSQPVERNLPEAKEKGASPVGEEKYYAHSMMDRHVGYTHYIVTETTQYQNEQVSGKIVSTQRSSF